MIHAARKAIKMKIQKYFSQWSEDWQVKCVTIYCGSFFSATCLLHWHAAIPLDLAPPNGRSWPTLKLKICWSGVVIMPAAVVYLCIALFTELFNLAGGDIPVLITVSTLVERQASADSTFPRSWIIKTHHFILSHTPHRSVVLRFEGKKRTKKASFIPKRHTAHNHHWSARTCHTLHAGKKKSIIYNSLSSRRSVMSNSSEGKILLNILKSLPKRGIWMIRQEGAWMERRGGEGRKTEREMLSLSTKQRGNISTAQRKQELRREKRVDTWLDIQRETLTIPRE